MDKHIPSIVKYIWKKHFLGGAVLGFMECLECGNCKSESIAYFCLMKNDFVVNNEKETLILEKNRSGWKKGDPEYETHRRKTRKEVEI